MTAAAVLLAAALEAAALTVEGLPPEAPRTGTIITIDVSTNQAYLFRDGTLVRKSAAATGSDKILRKGRKVWWFRTPRGRHQVVRKVKDPVWRKPDWAFVEEGKPIPPANSPLREERGTMGKYALDLGERVMIHGTNDPKSIGRRVSHGCIRLPNDMLTLLWKEAPVGTEVYIFESKPREITEHKGLNDLDLTSYP
jgi:L,D-transpeptidase ErfK/SrfK